MNENADENRDLRKHFQKWRDLIWKRIIFCVQINENGDIDMICVHKQNASKSS